MTAPLPRTLQDLPPRWAHFCLGLERFAAEDLGLDLGRARLVVGRSGGLDSTALLLACRCLTVRSGGAVLAGLLDHGLRPESAGDARAAAELCTALGVPCESRRVDVGRQAAANGQGLEEAGRELRYALLEDLRSKSGADWIVLGHHLTTWPRTCSCAWCAARAGPGFPACPHGTTAAASCGPCCLRPRPSCGPSSKAWGCPGARMPATGAALPPQPPAPRGPAPTSGGEPWIPGIRGPPVAHGPSGRPYWSAQMDQLPGVLHGPDGPFLDGGFLEQAHPACACACTNRPWTAWARARFWPTAFWPWMRPVRGRFGAVFQFPGTSWSGWT
jgi:hypothetical protein